MDLDNDERKGILAEIAEFAKEPELEDNEVTVRMFAQQEGLSISRASNRLEKLWGEGKLERREVLHEGKRKNAYTIAGRGMR